MKYTISITHEQMEFILSAIRAYTASLHQSIREQSSESLMKKQAQANPFITLDKPRKPHKSAEAPWGYKKDGTPKKRPGRAIKIKEVANEIQA